MQKIKLLIVILVSFIGTINSQVISLADGEVSVLGELKKWHKITIAIGGPNSSELAISNPALDYKLTGIFTNGTQTFIVPGYFAADGNAANTSATSGNIWKIHFTPPTTGDWNYTIRFRSGLNSAVENSLETGTAVANLDNKTGVFNVTATDKTGIDLRAKGRLQYVGEHYLKFQETGEWFLKAGPDSPENLLAYEDIDNTPNYNNRRKSYAPHSQDYVSGNPTWGNKKGTELIGAINYLASKGLNSISFLTFNINGDDKNVFPYVAENNLQQFDCSKLDQWEVIFSHAESKGMYLHFKTQETENERLLDDGNLGINRKAYYRQLIARFGHHLALNWNLGEENGSDQGISQNDSQRQAMAQYFHDNDPYKHNIVVHTYPNQHEKIYEPLLGGLSQLTGVSIQTDYKDVHAQTLEWITKSNTAGKKWVVANDEQGSADIGVPDDSFTFASNNFFQNIFRSRRPNLHDIRKNVLWGNLMAGGAGIEYYFGYDIIESDLSLQNFRSRDASWNYCRIALDFFQKYLPFWEMKNYNFLTVGENDYTFAKEGEVYAIYLKNGGEPTINLSGQTGTYTISWYDPRTGGILQTGSKETIQGGVSSRVGLPPNSKDLDWVVLIKKQIINTVCSATISSTSTLIKEGESLVLTANEGVSYEWYKNNIKVENNNTNSYTASAVGNYRVIVTDASGCSATSADYVIVIKNSISFVRPLNNDNTDKSIVVEVKEDNISSTLKGIDLYLDNVFVRKESFSPYVWNSTNGGLLDAKLSNLSLDTHTHQLKAIATYSDNQTAESIITINNKEIISNKEIKEFNIYPVPFKNTLNINSPNSIESIKLFDSTGKFQKNILFQKGSKSVTINTENIPLGIYILEVTTSNNTITKKIIKN